MPSNTIVDETRAARSARTRKEPQRTIGFWTASAIVIANIIGTGVFTSLGFQLVDLSSGFVLALFHLTNLKVGSTFQNLSTAVKIALILILIVAGAFFAPKQTLSFAPAHGDFMSILGAPFAVALVYVMYSYSGWNASAYIIGEIRNPERNVPRSLLVGTIIVMAAYVLLNAVFLITAPESELRGQIEVGLISGKHIFGDQGGRIVGAIICLGLISAISSMTWIGPRVTMSMGEDHWLLRFLGRKNAQGVPANAVFVQLLIVNLLLLTRSFDLVVIYIQFALLLCSLLTVIGVVVLRMARPEIARPYRVWLYPIPPIVFAAITVWIMVYLLRSKTTESIAGLGTAIAGFLLYFCARRSVSAGQ